MVLFYTSTAYSGGQVSIHMGRDKVENEDLIKYALPNDCWFHVDKLSSAHVYLRLPEGMLWDAIDPLLLADCAQLVKANSIQGNKKNDITIIYTPAANLKKTGDMEVGQVSFHSDKKVKRTYVPERINAIINRLEKTKRVVEVDHEADRIERLKVEGKAKRLEVTERRNSELELARSRKKEAEGKSYDSLWTKTGTQEEEEEEWERRQRQGSFDPEDDFM